jgi:hypothetical protein
MSAAAGVSPVKELVYMYLSNFFPVKKYSVMFSCGIVSFDVSSSDFMCNQGNIDLLRADVWINLRACSQFHQNNLFEL